jgi:hypothetical protein
MTVRMNAEFLWRLDNFPHEGTIVWITHNNQPLRWSYLPEGATRFDVEKEFGNGYRWRQFSKPIVDITGLKKQLLGVLGKYVE